MNSSQSTSVDLDHHRARFVMGTLLDLVLTRTLRIVEIYCLFSYHHVYVQLQAIAWLAKLNKQPLALPFLISSTSRPLFEVIITKYEGILSSLASSLGSLDI